MYFERFFFVGEQQDVQEFLQYFRDYCGPAWNTCPHTKNLLNDLFEGIINKKNETIYFNQQNIYLFDRFLK